MDETSSEFESQQTEEDGYPNSQPSSLYQDEDTASLVSYNSDSDSTDSNLLNYFLDFDDIIGKDLVIFSYMKPKDLHLFKPSPVDTLKSLAKFVKHNTDYNHHFHRMAILFPSEMHPQEIGDVVTLVPGTALMVLPKTLCKLTIVIHRLDTLFEVDVDICTHVLSIKHRIEVEHGFPIHQQDLLFDGQCLENVHRLYQYNIRSQSVLDLHIQYNYNMVIRVKTFWKVVYNLFVDPCMLVSELLEIILRRCVSPNTYGDMSILDDFMIPKQVLTLTNNRRTLNQESTLGWYNIKDGDTIMVTTIGRQHKVNVYPTEVSLNDGRAARIVVSEFDTWAIVALHLHGITNMPLDKIRLFHNDYLVNYVKPIGTSASIGYIEIRHPEQKHRQKLKPRITSTNTSEVDVTVYLGSNVTETINCPRNYSMSDIKARLEGMGIPNVAQYTLASKYSILPDTVLIENIVKKDQLDLKVTLKLEHLPLTVQLPNNNLLNLTLQVTETLGAVRDKIEKKSKLSLKNYKLLLGGQEFNEDPATLAYDSGLSIGTTLHLVPNQSSLSFQIHSDMKQIKLKVPLNQNLQQMKEILWREKNLPSSCLLSLETFLRWHISMVSRVKNVNPAPHAMILPNISHPLYTGNKSEDAASKYSSSNNSGSQSELSPTIGTLQFPRKRVHFTDNPVHARPRAATGRRKLANIQIPVFPETYNPTINKLDTLSTPGEWPLTKGTTSHLPEIENITQPTQDDIDNPGEEENFERTTNLIEPWSYIS